MKTTPKNLAKSMMIGLTFDEAWKLVDEQFKVNIERAEQMMFWREVMVELLALKPKEKQI